MQALTRARALNAIAFAAEHAVDPEGEGPLVLVKDNIAVRGMPWTAGSPLFVDVVAPRDAAAVTLIAAAGGRPAIRTTLHELAFGVTGANGWTGPILNPFSADHMAGGSSGGSAAALAVGLGDVSLVTDTGGSARIPAAHCGILGFRPSTGRYPADGLIGLSPSRDTIGLMARDLDAIRWADAVLTPGQGGPALPNARRIGVVAQDMLGPIAPDVATAYLRLCDLLRDAGWELRTVDLSAIFACDEACGFAIAMHETHQSLLSAVPALTGHAYGDRLDAVATPDVAHMLALAAQPLGDGVYAEAIGRGWPALRAAYAGVFGSGVDFLLTPTSPMTAPPVGTDATMEFGGETLAVFPAYTRFTRPDSMAGLPSISMPFGADGTGLPIGMMLAAPRFADRALLDAAGALLAIEGFPAAPAAL